ncbi:hypothetical protein D6C78_09052, partial [Aureobasidium pullulans]
ANIQVARCSVAATLQSSHADVQLCLSPSDIPSSTILATRCLKDTRPPNRALLQPAALHSRRSDKRSLAAGLYILALHAFNKLLGSALPPGRKGSRSLMASRTHGQVGHIRAGQRRAKIQGSTSLSKPPPSVRTTNGVDDYPHGSLSPTQAASFGSNYRRFLPCHRGRLTTAIFNPAPGSIVERPNIRRSILRKQSVRSTEIFL